MIPRILTVPLIGLTAISVTRLVAAWNAHRG
jgi:hypothetical protein